MSIQFSTTPGKNLTYAERLRKSMRGDNSTKGRLTVKQLGALVGYSGESIRRLTVGHPTASRSLNDAVCEVLGLPAEAMWQIAIREKVTYRHGSGFLATMPHDTRLSDLWKHLSSVDQENLVRMAEAMVLAKSIGGTASAAALGATSSPASVFPMGGN